MLKLIFAVLFSAQLAQAVTFKVIGKNGEVLASGEQNVSLPQTVGQVSVDFFNTFAVPFVGDIDGIVSIHGLGSDMDLISDSEMKAYGWCYSIDGVVPEDFVHKISIDAQKTELIWFYAYAYYKSGQWTHQCVPHGEVTSEEAL